MFDTYSMPLRLCMYARRGTQVCLNKTVRLIKILGPRSHTGLYELDKSQYVEC